MLIVDTSKARYLEYASKLFSEYDIQEDIRELRNGRMGERVRGFEVVSKYKGQDIILPRRSTKYSAGYDFYANQDIIIPPSLSLKANVNMVLEKYHDWYVTPTLAKTCIKAYMQEDEVLLLFNRSSNPKKKGLVLANGTGVVDSDYYNNPNNEGEIGFMFFNITSSPVVIKKGEKIGQGVFQKWYLADNDDTNGERKGGFGSTGK